ncbi:hypothetical protein ES319_D08G133800v1 [Gossypium barbadense]|uniref:Uncharacterized protein n=3 Tax=Gossypium TaxID=3633 RepID=A0A5J5QDS0_GOSBA|nr:hypothetical protein ES319_D08G133800v1 [Gossypium barbadense]TYG57455.1 hypothetical protein ES288_D08G142800v1 [Gossypium darwinii]TYH58253.1 hypothetical protein ES332_D08G140800v1 [Gossypium tomentosum]
MMANKKATFCGFMLMWLLARKLFGKQTIERYRQHTKDNETNKPIEQNLQYLKAESANMLKTVEDLEVSRRYWSFYKIQPPTKIYIGVKI